MHRRLLVLLAVLVVCAGWFIASPLIGLSKLANAVAARNVAAIDQRVDFTRLGGSLADQFRLHMQLLQWN